MSNSKVLSVSGMNYKNMLSLLSLATYMKATGDALAGNLWPKKEISLSIPGTLQLILCSTQKGNNTC